MSGKVTKIFFWFAFISFAGCATMQVTNTQRSSIEQQLLISSLERVLTALNTEPLQEKRVAIDFYGLTPDKDFAKEFCTAWLQAKRPED
jgi:hypothetical protein